MNCLSNNKKHGGNKFRSQAFCVKFCCFLGIVLMSVEMILGVLCITQYRAISDETKNRAQTITSLEKIEQTMVYASAMMNNYIGNGAEIYLTRWMS